MKVVSSGKVVVLRITTYFEKNLFITKIAYGKLPTNKLINNHLKAHVFKCELTALECQI